MKTSILLITALLLNTAFLFAEPLSALIQGINPWVFVAIEGVLLVGYFLNKWLAELSKDFMLGIGYLDVYVKRDQKK